MIIIEPFGGLANRLRVLTSAMDLSEKTNQKIKMIWVENNDLNCRFLDLFLPLGDVEVINSVSKYKHLKCSVQENKIKSVISNAINKMAGIDFCIKDKDLDINIRTKELDLLEILSNNENVYFQTCHNINRKENIEYYEKLRPVDEIQKIIDRNTEKFNDATIGLHIRRTDNIKSIKFSPTSLFIENMHKELRKNSNANFFLATDDQPTEFELKEIFGDKIITYDKELNRNSNKGIVDALVDLYCLSNTKHIYGSYWSSFSIIASKIGNNELFILKNELPA